MGEYFNWVNVNKREYLCPGDFDCGNKSHESQNKNNPVLRALYELLSECWKGDPIVFLGDEASIPGDTPYGLLHDLFVQAGTEHYFDFICENYRNVACLFHDAEVPIKSLPLNAGNQNSTQRKDTHRNASKVQRDAHPVKGFFGAFDLDFSRHKLYHMASSHHNVKLPSSLPSMAKVNSVPFWMAAT